MHAHSPCIVDTISGRMRVHILRAPGWNSMRDELCILGKRQSAQTIQRHLMQRLRQCDEQTGKKGDIYNGKDVRATIF